ncbi:uncharacterized protein LOC112092766 [Morus notabilis]|uniref:uncharacterized protein LOC112092766 n=1 Tax=Morus notabilis TaxID=981085 RepID=UPI000CED5320|nr:uncharacterized protein LOC112092766 [Morus notabilis]
MFHQQVIASFAQQHLEPFYVAWGRFNDMVERYSNHNLSNQFLTFCFYNGLDEATRSWVDYRALTTGGHLLNRSHKSAMYLLNDMVDFDYHWHWDPSLQGWSHPYPSYISHPDIRNQPFEHQKEKKMRLEEAMAELGNAINHLIEWTKNLKVENQMVNNQMWLDDGDSNNQGWESETNDMGASQEFEPLEEIEPQDEEKEPFEVVLAQSFTKLDYHMTDTDVPFLVQEMSFQGHDFYEDQIASMVLDSQVEREEHFEGMPEEFLQEGEIKELMEDVEAHETIGLSSSMALLYTPSYDPFWLSSSPPPYYILYEPEPKMKFSNQAHHFSKANLIGAVCLNCKNHTKLKGVTRKDPCVVSYDTYYGRKPLFDERFTKSLAKDVKASAPWKATQVF